MARRRPAIRTSVTFAHQQRIPVAARREARLQARRVDAGRRDGARRVPPVGQRQVAPTRTRQGLHRGGQGEARTLQDGRQPVEGHRPDADEHDHRTRPARSSSTCRSRAAARRPCSSPAVTSTPTSTIRTRTSASGRPARSRPLCVFSPKRLQSATEGHGDAWAGPTSRPARKPGMPIDQFQQPRTRLAARGTSRPTRSRSTRT